MPVVDITCKSGFKYPVFQVGDRNHPIPAWVPDFGKRLAEMREMNVRADDIFVGGQVRSGTNWAYEIVSMVVRQDTMFAKEMPYQFAPDMVQTDNLPALAESWESPRVIFHHVRLNSELPFQIREKRPKIIIIIRNPKDTLVSAYNFFMNLKGPRHFSGSWDDFLFANMEGLFPAGSWFDYVLDVEQFQKENPEVPVHILVYEKMKENLFKEVQDLCKFLEKPTDIAEEIARIGQFETFKPAIEKFKFDAALTNLFRKDAGQFFRKGIVGDWKDWFTVAQDEAYNSLYQEQMAGSKLGDVMRTYIGL